MVTQLIIVGAVPIGLFLAADLGLRGVRCYLVGCHGWIERKYLGIRFTGEANLAEIHQGLYRSDKLCDRLLRSRGACFKRTRARDLRKRSDSASSRHACRLARLQSV